MRVLCAAAIAFLALTASALAQDVSELTKAQLANAQKQLRGVRAPEIKSPLSDSSTAQHEPVPDAQHQVAMQKATGQELPDRDSSSTDAIERSPAVRVNMASQGDGPDLLIKSTTPSAVFFMTIAMAACSGLGAVPFFFVGALSKEWAALANAVACGVMLAASFDLLHEGQPYGAGFVILGLLSGAMFINASQERLQKFEDVKFEGLQGASARKIVLVVGIMAAHALGEGSGVGVSFCGNRGWAQGLLVTLAIGLHNIPEGLAVATVLVARGISAKHAFWWTIFTSMPQPLLALPSFVFVETFRNLLPLALGFAAGCMLWMVFAELLPDALEDSKAGKVATAATFSAAWLEALRMMLAGLEQPDGGVAISFDGDFRAGMHASAMLLLCTGACAAVTGGVIAAACTPAAVTLGTAAGLVSFMGGADLAYQLVSNPHTHVTGTVLAAIVGACGAVLAYRWGLSQTSTGIVDKAKKDVESLQESANGRNGDWHVLDEAGRGAPLSSTFILPVTNGDTALLEGQRNLSQRQVFPAKHHGRLAAGPSTMRSVAAGLALVVLAIAGVPIGWKVAEISGSSPSEAARLLLPVGLRAVMTAAAVALMAGHLTVLRTSALPTLAAVLVCCVTPITAAVEILKGSQKVAHAARLPHRHWLCHAESAVFGMLLTVGLQHLLAVARHMRTRAAQIGFVLGLLGGGLVYALLQVLCWSSPYCVVALT